MTLRVRVSIVPFGNEDDEYEIHQINISNIGATNTPDVFLYGVEVDKYKTFEYDEILQHDRTKDALELVRKTLERVCNG